VDSSALTSILRAVPSVPTLAMRRAVIERGLFGLPASDAASLLQALAERAAEGDRAARVVALGLASAIAHRRRAGDTTALEVIEQAALDAQLTLAASLCGAACGARSLAKGGRLPEVGLNTEAYFPSIPRVYFPNPDGPRIVYTAKPEGTTALGRGFLGDELKPLAHLRAHPDGRFLARLLRTRWIRQRDVLIAASRRPSTPEIAIAIAADDRWLLDHRVCEALLENPFTPGWLVAALRLALRHASAKHAEPVTNDAS
jgi:hypothetical protein